MCAYPQDLGSETDVTVNGKKVGKNEEVELSVGSEISFGSDTVYKVSTTLAWILCIILSKILLDCKMGCCRQYAA